jgi:hypothetical protein
MARAATTKAATAAEAPPIVTACPARPARRGPVQPKRIARYPNPNSPTPKTGWRRSLARPSLLALQAAKKPHAAYKPVGTRGNADAHVMLLTRMFRNSCRSAPPQEPDS